VLNRSEKVVEQVLAPLGAVTLRAGADGPDIVLETAGGRYAFDVRWAGEGFPEDVRAFLPGRGRRTRRRRSPPVGRVLVVAARRMSPGARRLLEQHGIGWADETGAARIVAPPGLLIHSAPPAGSGPARSGEWTWSDAAAIVGEVILADVVRGELDRDERGVMLPRAAEIAERAGVSPSLVNLTLRGWEREGWIDKPGPTRGPGSVRLLTDPGQVLSSWAAWMREHPPVEVGGHTLFRDAIIYARDELPALLPGEAWCVSGLVASELQAPPPCWATPRMTIFGALGVVGGEDGRGDAA